MLVLMLLMPGSLVPVICTQIGAVEARLEDDSGFREYGIFAVYAGLYRTNVQRLEARARGEMANDGYDREDNGAGSAGRD
jgi:hypothetical protein